MRFCLLLILTIPFFFSCKSEPQFGNQILRYQPPTQETAPSLPEESSSNGEVVIAGKSPASLNDNCDGSIWGFNDPLMINQWHLCNSSQEIPDFLVRGDLSQDGRFLNSLAKYSGTGVTYKVTDSGLDVEHEDIVDNNSGMGKDFCADSGADHNSTPSVEDPHGTKVTGIIAARGKNGIGVSGISHQAKVTADNLISQCQVGETETKFTNAVTFMADIWNGSYGFGCDTGWIPRNGNLMSYRAFTMGAVGNDTVYVKANGNSRGNCRPNGNADLYGGHPYILAIAAVDNKGGSTSYSTQGPNLALSGFAGYGFDDRPGICTTDVNGNYTCEMNGTSAASPFVAGVVGLVREANPSLKFVDIHSILMRTARKSTDQDYLKNDAGYEHSWNSGFGIVDSDSAVKLAETYKNYLEIPILYSEKENNDVLPNATMATAFTENACASQSIDIANEFQIFASEFGFDIDVETDVRDLEVFVTTPGGTRFPLNKTTSDVFLNVSSERVSYDLGSSLGYSQVIMSKQFFGMQAKGKWTFEACNTNGTFNGVQLDIYGWKENVIPNKQVNP